jgi:ubiquinone/menaquinone biosynthesis C-methylase UbiE
VLASHRRRTAENSAAYLLPHLRPGLDLLDVGCGPGTITLDLARIVAPGRVTGVDTAVEVVAQASATASGSSPGVGNVTFAAGDVYALQLDDASFDVVHAHQVLQHLTDPVAGLREMQRVLRPGGILAVRDSDYAAFAWAPADALLDRWLDLYHAVTRRNGGEADAGRYLLGWVQRAGFRDAVATSSTWTFATPQPCARPACDGRLRPGRSRFDAGHLSGGAVTGGDLSRPRLSRAGAPRHSLESVQPRCFQLRMPRRPRRCTCISSNSS